MMARIEPAERRGWIASVIFHAAVIIALFFVHLRTQMDMPEFVDMSWGAPASASGALNVSARALAASQPRAARSQEEDNIELPKRSPSMFPEEAINMSSSKKTVNPDALPNYMPSNKMSGAEQKSSASLPESQGRDVKAPAAGREGGAGVASPYGAGTGTSGGQGVSYGIQWSGGGTRRLESGRLPSYPPGVNREAQIKLKLVVSPSGAVKSAQPLQKGETRLENAALKAVQLWKFDPLQSSQPSVDQTCIVTFNFRLK